MLKVLGNIWLSRVIKVFALCLLVSGFCSGVSEAASPAWIGGFPKISQKDVLLQWTPVKGAGAYKVYRSEEKGKGYKSLATVKTNHYTDKGLPGGKTFYYEVSAVVGGAEGARSAEAEVAMPREKAFVPLKVPTLMGGIIKDLPGGKVQVNIRWEGAAGTNLVGVNIYRSKTKGKGYAMIGSSPADRYEDLDVEHGVTYYYVVTSVDNQFAETNYSNEVNVEVPKPVAAEAKAAAPAAAPAGVKPTEMRKTKLLFYITKRFEVGPDGRPVLDADGKPVEVNISGVGDVKVDEAVGHIYVTSWEYNGILVYDMNGNFQFGIRKDGVFGSENLAMPAGIAVGPGGDLYVGGASSNEIAVFTFDGKPKKTIKLELNDLVEAGFNDNINQPITYSLAVDGDGTLYVSDPGNNKIHVYSPDGRPVLDIGHRITPGIDKRIKIFFNGPTFIALDKSGNLVMIDSGFSRMMVYDKKGKMLRTIGKKGTTAGDLDFPTGIAVDKDGIIYSASGSSPNIQGFTGNGDFAFALCNESCNGPFDNASEMRGICIDSRDRLYVAESGLKRVAVLQVIREQVKVTPK